MLRMARSWSREWQRPVPTVHAPSPVRGVGTAPACSAILGYAGMRSHLSESAFGLMTESEFWIRGRYHEVYFLFYYQ